MPFTGDFAKVKRAARVIQDLSRPGSATQRAAMAPCVPAVKALLDEQFRQGLAPNGSKQPARKDGKPALVSEKLARGAIGVEIRGTELHGFAKSPHLDDILETQQKGHVFAPQSSTQFRLRGKQATAGRLVSKSKFLKRVQDTASYHRPGSDEWSYTMDDKSGRAQFRGERRRVMVGLRVLRARHIRPEGTDLPPRWGRAIGRGLFVGMRGVLDRVK